MKAEHFIHAAIATAFYGLAIAGARDAAAQAVVEVDTKVAAVLEVDDARIAAMTSVDETALTAIFDDELHYAHSSGMVDTKESFIDLVVSGRSKYLEYESLERDVTFPRDDVALMAGRARVVVENDKGRNEFTLSYLAVWRQVQGEWKFLAWQSARLPPP